MKIQRILHLLTLKQSSFPHEVGISISIFSRVRVIGGGDLIIKCENRFFGVGITTPPPNILPLSLKALPPVYTAHATKQPMPSFWLSPYRSSQFHKQLSNPETHPFQVSSKPTWETTPGFLAGSHSSPSQYLKQQHSKAVNVTFVSYRK